MCGFAGSREKRGLSKKEEIGEKNEIDGEMVSVILLVCLF